MKRDPDWRQNLVDDICDHICEKCDHLNLDTEQLEMEVAIEALKEMTQAYQNRLDEVSDDPDSEPYDNH